MSHKTTLAEMIAASVRDLPPPPDSRTLEPGRNSALYWFPRIEGVWSNIPQTKLVRFDNRTMWPMCDNDPIPDVPWGEFETAAAAIGYPSFVRSDQSSAKHEGPSAYRMDGLEDLRRVLCDTFYDSCLKDLEVLAFMFREWVGFEQPDLTFRAFGKPKRGLLGHLIANEWRFFAGPDGLEARYFYWPGEAIDGHHPDQPDWCERLKRMQEIPPPPEVEQAAVRAAQACGGSWSVDFAQGTDGRWWLIDMAEAHRSWRPRSLGEAIRA